VSGAVVELLDEVDEDEPVLDWLSALDVAGVAAHRDVELESVEVAVELLLSLDCVASVGVTVWAALSVAWTAIAPPRPRSAATLAVAVALRARRAGCARFRRGVASGIGAPSVGRPLG
jgi:hypothetical protein